MNTKTIINDYIEALTARAEMAGDDKLAFVAGFLEGTLKTLKLQSYELEVLQQDIRALNTIINANKA